MEKMPSIKRFISRKFQYIFLGYSLKDKLRIIGIGVLQLVPKPIRKRISRYLDEKIEGITEKLWRCTVFEIDSIRYALLDYESVAIVSPEFERFMPLWLKPRKGEVLVDIGAHVGKYTLPVAKVVGNRGMVVAIEPHPVNYQTLQKNIELNNIQNVIALNLAAWNTDCEIKLFLGVVAGRHSAKVNRKLGWIEVKARVMDRALKELNLGRVDWIKIDVEGAECEVSYGLEETISKFKPKIIIEVFHENVEKMKRFMKEHGYGLIRISPVLEQNVYFFCIPFS